MDNQRVNKLYIKEDLCKCDRALKRWGTSNRYQANYCTFCWKWLNRMEIEDVDTPKGLRPSYPNPNMEVTNGS